MMRCWLSLLLLLLLCVVVCCASSCTGSIGSSDSFAIAPLSNSIETIYGIINLQHLVDGITLPNYQQTTTTNVQLQYAVNNLPASERIGLTRLTLLFDVNPSPRIGKPDDLPHSLSLHIARPLEIPVEVQSLARTVYYVKSVTIPSVESNVEIDLKPYGLVLEVNDILVLSSPNDAILLRAGLNAQGQPVALGVIQVTQGEPDETNKTLTILNTQQQIQLCTSYGAVTAYDQWFGWDNYYVFSSEARQIQPADGLLHQITVGFFLRFHNPQTYSPAANLQALVQVVFAIPIASDKSPSQGYYLEVNRDPQLYTVTNNVPFNLPTPIPVHQGEIVGCRIADTTHSLLLSVGDFSLFPVDAAALGGGRSGQLFQSPLASQGAKLDESQAYYNLSSPPLLGQAGFQYLVSHGATAQGDPQFAGFQGQSFQFYGLADEHFNLISSPQLQLNSHFIYLSSGKCDFNDTLCFQHPGTYIDELGFTIPSQQQHDVMIKLVAGSHQQGLRMWMGSGTHGAQDEMTEISMGKYEHGLKWSLDTQRQQAKVAYNKFGQVTIDTPLFHINVVNSEFFFNLEFALLNRRMLHVGSKKHIISDHTICQHDKNEQAQVLNDQSTHHHGMVEQVLITKYHMDLPLHGLVGQTWRNVIVCGKHWMGSVQDYVVSDLFGSDYYYNFYNTSKTVQY